MIELDRDNFDSVMQRLKPGWEGVVRDPAGTSSAELPAALTFAELDDFHPDRLAQKIPPLRALLETRRALANPEKFADRAAEVVGERTEPATPSQEAAFPVSDVNSQAGSVLDRILGGPKLSEPRQPPTTRLELRRLLEALVAPHLVRVDTTRQAELTAAVDEALAAQVRAILHDPSFQRLEATWRNLWRLVTAIESDVEVKIRLLPCNKAVLRRELVETDDPSSSPIVRALIEPAAVPGGERPALLIGDFEFGPSTEDLQLLGMLGAIGEQLGAPFLAAASSRLLGCETFLDVGRAGALGALHNHPTLQQFRRLSQARWVGLALPRLLVRLPYGSDTDRAETFDFEEWTDASGYADYLWGNPAYAIAGLAIANFNDAGWGFDLSQQVHRLDGLPLHVYRRAGESVTTPCAEIAMTDTLIEALEEAGFIPLASHQNRDFVSLPCVQSLALPRAPLPLGAHA